jgi:hypothetical protein
LHQLHRSAHGRPTGETDMNAMIPVSNAEVYRASTDAAGLCRDIVLNTAQKIGDRQYVRVEGWQAIAIAHGCTASARDVEVVEGGVRAIGEIRRMSDGALIAQAEGFVGEDEPTWYGGVSRAWKWGAKKGEKIWYDKESPKRPDYAIRAMAQTRAISRACRSAFAHVVVLIDTNLSTTPAEEVPYGGFDNEDHAATSEPRNVTPEARTRQSLAVTAALSAIVACETRAELEKWLDANETAVAALPKADQAIIQKGYNTRFDALDPDTSETLTVSAEEVPEFA